LRGSTDVYHAQPNLSSARYRSETEGLADELLAQSPELLRVRIVVGVIPSLAVDLVLHDERRMLVLQLRVERSIEDNTRSLLN
jgi:hypothetical protein